MIVQSFEVTTLEALTTQLGCPLLQLVDGPGAAPADLVAAGDPRTYDDLTGPDGLKEIAGYATWIGPTKDRVVTPAGTPTPLLDDARAVGLATMPFTFRNENEFLPRSLRHGEHPGQPARAAPRSTYGDALAEYARFRALGVEGIFSDNGDTAVAAWTG